MIMTDYKISWNSNYFRTDAFLKDVKERRHSGIIMQQLNKAKNPLIPAIASTATITFDKKAHARAEIISPPVFGSFHDPYDIGRHNREQKNWVMIRITEVFDEPFELKGNQKTWCRMIH